MHNELIQKMKIGNKEGGPKKWHTFQVRRHTFITFVKKLHFWTTLYRYASQRSIGLLSGYKQWYLSHYLC